MKHLLLAFACFALFAGCSKHNDAQPEISPKTATVADITGKWQVQNDTTFAIVNGEANITDTDKPPFKNTSTATYLQFNADGTCSSDAQPTSHKFTLDEGTITIYSPYNGGTDPPEKYIILEITKSLLLIQTNTTATGYIHVTLSR